MSFDYAGLSGTALAIITQFGAAAVLKKRAAAVRNANTATVGMTVTSYTVRIVALELTEAQRSDNAQLLRPRRFLIAASGLVVSIDHEDTLVYQGVSYKVKNPGAVAPGGTTLVYDCVVEA